MHQKHAAHERWAGTRVDVRRRGRNLMLSHHVAPSPRRTRYLEVEVEVGQANIFFRGSVLGSVGAVNEKMMSSVHATHSRVHSGCSTILVLALFIFHAP